ncbi:MAG: ARMT1-like domain-containing protein, partial [Elusimicrobiaceae bacterium]
AVELAAAGNVIDFGFRKSTDISGEIKAIIDNISGSGRAHLDFKPFERTLKKAKTVLVVGDNAGETVFDRLLLEEIGRLYPGKKIYYAVRGYPALNDALMEDAFDAGLDKVATVITSGSDLPGTLVDQCTAEFRTLFKNADLVISKGQGNYETLTEETREIFYIFMVKCAMVSQDSGKPMGSYLLYHSKARKKK